MDLRPGWCRGPEGLTHGISPTCVRLPGKPRASGNGGWRGTQRGARSPRGGRSIPIRSTYPGGTLGIDGWATRTGQRGSALAACSESGIGDGVCINTNIVYGHHLPHRRWSGKCEPGCRRPTGPALRPTNRRGVSGKPGWGVSPQTPEVSEGVAQEGRRKLKLLAAQ